jgi:hypothetical protein
VLLPDKHIRLGESILGLGTLVLTYLDRPVAFDELMAKLETKFETSDWPAYHNAETVTLALCFLHSTGLVEVSAEGDVYRCD